MSEQDKLQKLIDLCFELGLHIHQHRFMFDVASNDQVAEWIAKQLKECGFHTIPKGSKWGVLIDQEKDKCKNRSDNKHSE